MKIGFLSTRRQLTNRVFDVSLTLTLVGFLLSFYGWALVQIRLLGLLGLTWAVMSYAMQWKFGQQPFRWWVHLIGFVVIAVVFCLLMVVFHTDIMILDKKAE